MTADWLSNDDGPVPLAIVGEADEISSREGGENTMQDSPAVRVFIEAGKHWNFGGFHGVGQEACAGTCEVAREWAHRRFIGATSSHRLSKRTPPRTRKLAV